MIYSCLLRILCLSSWEILFIAFLCLLYLCLVWELRKCQPHKTIWEVFLPILRKRLCRIGFISPLSILWNSPVKPYEIGMSHFGYSFYKFSVFNRYRTIKSIFLNFFLKGILVVCISRNLFISSKLLNLLVLSYLSYFLSISSHASQFPALWRGEELSLLLLSQASDDGQAPSHSLHNT